MQALAKHPWLPPPAESSLSGPILETRTRYTQLAELGSGGMATVFLARQVGWMGVTRLVALKRIRAPYSSDDSFVRMFLDEAKLSSQLQHPNAVRVLDFGEDRDGHFLVMEYLRGLDLRMLMRKYQRQGGKGLDPCIVARIMADAAAGLHAAHELTGPTGDLLGVVHRDVSPHNLFLGDDGMVRVMDFGVAKAAGRLTRTQDGSVKGKIAYMAPEQLMGGPIDRRSDLFAMGICMWELITGRRLFRGATPAETMGRVCRGSIPSVLRYAPQTPPAIAEVVDRLLARCPDERPASGRSVRDTLLRVLRQTRWVSEEELASLAQRYGGVRGRGFAPPGPPRGTAATVPAAPPQVALVAQRSGAHDEATQELGSDALVTQLYEPVRPRSAHAKEQSGLRPRTNVQDGGGARSARRDFSSRPPRPHLPVRNSVSRRLGVAPLPLLLGALLLPLASILALWW